MKKMALTLALAAGFMVSAAQHTIESLPIGSKIPLSEKILPAVNGNPVSLEKARSHNGLLVMFSCNTCPYVIRSQKRTAEMMKYAFEKGIGMVIINSNEAQRNDEDAPDAMKKYAQKQHYRVPYLIDENAEFADAFGATRTPEVFLFDAGGKLVYKGAMEDNPANPEESKVIYLRKAIDYMLTGNDMEPNTTKSIGCSIKRRR